LEKKWDEFTIGEFIGITKTRLVTLVERCSTNLESQEVPEPVPLLDQLRQTLEKYKKVYHVKTIYGGHFLCQHLDYYNYDITPLFSPKQDWNDFVEKTFLGKELESIKLDWTCSSHCLALTICSLVTSSEYLLVE